VIVGFRVYCWLLCLYPGSYRDEFGEEMTSVFCEARSALPPDLAATISFYRREFCGVLSSALCAQFGRLFGPGIPFRRFHMQAERRFPRSTVFLMLVIFAGTVLTISKVSSVAGDTLGSAWRALEIIFVVMLITVCIAAAVVTGILHVLRRSGVHRLENVHN
jgi:hypothetical protein